MSSSSASPLRAQGLIRGGSLDSALVCDASRWINGPLRFADEPVRHKLLDLVGDLALLRGGLPRAHVVAYKASHRLHVRLARALEEREGMEEKEEADEEEEVLRGVSEAGGH